MTSAEKRATIIHDLYRHSIGSCSCMTKSPEIAYHSPDCLYVNIYECIKIIQGKKPDAHLHVS